MHHCEGTSDVDGEFRDALALLRSSEEDSTEKLRRMLDACIERRYGPGRTLAARMPKRFLQQADASAIVAANRTMPRDDHVVADRSMTIDVLEVGYVDCYDDEDIPRISIPDEGFTDTTVCKICNGAKLGPLILLECQECQETYHPLCHQPPIVDADVYDPRFVWRCRRCVETSAATSARCTTPRGESAERTLRRNDDRATGTSVPPLKLCGRRRNVDSFGRSDHPLVENRTTQLHDSPLPAKNLTNPSQRNGSLLLSATTQSTRKRIGSKLTVARAAIK